MQHPSMLNIMKVVPKIKKEYKKCLTWLPIILGPSYTRRKKIIAIKCWLPVLLRVVRKRKRNVVVEANGGEWSRMIFIIFVDTCWVNVYNNVYVYHYFFTFFLVLECTPLSNIFSYESRIWTYLLSF